ERLEAFLDLAAQQPEGCLHELGDLRPSFRNEDRRGDKIGVEHSRVPRGGWTKHPTSSQARERSCTAGYTGTWLTPRCLLSAVAPGLGSPPIGSARDFP